MTTPSYTFYPRDHFEKTALLTQGIRSKVIETEKDLNKVTLKVAMLPGILPDNEILEASEHKERRDHVLKALNELQKRLSTSTQSLIPPAQLARIEVTLGDETHNSPELIYAEYTHPTGLRLKTAQENKLIQIGPDERPMTLLLKNSSQKKTIIELEPSYIDAENPCAPYNEASISSEQQQSLVAAFKKTQYLFNQNIINEENCTTLMTRLPYIDPYNKTRYIPAFCTNLQHHTGLSTQLLSFYLTQYVPSQTELADQTQGTIPLAAINVYHKPDMSLVHLVKDRIACQKTILAFFYSPSQKTFELKLRTREGLPYENRAITQKRIIKKPSSTDPFIDELSKLQQYPAPSTSNVAVGNNFWHMPENPHLIQAFSKKSAQPSSSLQNKSDTDLLFQEIDIAADICDYCVNPNKRLEMYVQEKLHSSLAKRRGLSSDKTSSLTRAERAALNKITSYIDDNKSSVSPPDKT